MNLETCSPEMQTAMTAALRRQAWRKTAEAIGPRPPSNASVTDPETGTVRDLDDFPCVACVDELERPGGQKGDRVEICDTCESRLAEALGIGPDRQRLSLTRKR